MKKGKRTKKNTIYCPYCGARAVLMTFRDIYGPDASTPDEKIWACSNFPNGCDAYVQTHKGTEKPYGQLANAALRSLRIRAHRSINRVVQAGIMDKHTIYDYLETSLGFREGKFHLGNSMEYHCNKVIEIMDDIYKREVRKRV